MFNIQREEFDWCGRRLVLETGRLARQADGAVFASWGETTVLATVVAAKEAKPGQDFFPLDRPLPGEGVRRRTHSRRLSQARRAPSDRETLTSRLIDRPIRPLFPEGFRCDTQVIATVFSYDLERLGHSGDGRLLGRADPLRRASWARSGGRASASSRAKSGSTDGRGNEGLDPRSRRRRHGRRRADGRIGSPGAFRGGDAESGDGRPRRIPAGPPGDHPSRRKGRQGAPGTRRARPFGGRKSGHGGRRGGSARSLRAHPEAGALRRRRRRQGQGDGGARAAGRGGQIPARGDRRGVPRRPGQGRALEHPRP